MIQIMSVIGDVLVEDRNKKYTLLAQPGLMLDDQGDILIVTNSMSSTTINMNGKNLKLEPLSYMRIRPDGRTWWDRHGLAPGGDMRMWLGLIWAKLGGTAAEAPTGNATVGVRG